MKTEYNEDLHEYRIDGTQVPSVTTILRAAGLYNDSFFTVDSRDRGIYVHKACLYYLQDDLDDRIILDEYRGHIEAFKKFMAEADCKPHLGLCEIPWFSEIWLFGGTIDMPCVINGKESIIDIKSGAESPTTGIQLAAYGMLYDVPSANRYGLHLKANGQYKLIPYTDRNDIKIFNAALTLYHWRQERKLL